jgi:ATP-dependent exoDNAse (exonuclease V) beta subunit
VIVPYCHWKIDKFRENWIEIKENRIDLPIAVVTLSEKAADAGFETEIEEEKQALLLDNLNLLYVAFTRAVERLHIISQDKGSNTGGVNAWLLNVVPNTMEAKGNGWFESGLPEPKKHIEKQKGASSYALEPLSFGEKKVQFAVKAAYLHNAKEEDARAQGILLHWILSNIKHSSELDKALQLGELKGFYNNKRVPELKGLIEQILKHPKVAPCFKEGLKVKNEAELLTAQGMILRPDRIVFLETETVVMDYKSGKEHREQHANQVLEYASALQSLGYGPVRKLLVYLEENRVVELN